MTAGIWAAVPVKGFAGAKQRLAGALSPYERHAVASAMLEDVLEALAGADLAGIMVNTADPEAAALAGRYGARIVTLDALDGHTAAVAAMARLLTEEGAAAMLTLPGDIPRVTAGEVMRLCSAREPAPSFAIVPSHDERGSNAVLLCPPSAVMLRFGDDSFFPHLDAARAQGLEPTVVASPGIGLDLDNPDDLRAFMQAEPAMDTRAFRLLLEFGLPPG